MSEPPFEKREESEEQKDKSSYKGTRITDFLESKQSIRKSINVLKNVNFESKKIKEENHESNSGEIHIEPQEEISNRVETITQVDKHHEQSKILNSSVNNTSVAQKQNEKVLNDFLKINSLFHNKYIQEGKFKEKPNTNEPIYTNDTKPTNLNLQEDDEGNLVSILKEIDKEPISKNMCYFINGDKLKIVPFSDPRKEKQLNVGLQNIKILPKKADYYDRRNVKYKEDLTYNDLDFYYDKKNSNNY